MPCCAEQFILQLPALVDAANSMRLRFSTTLWNDRATHLVRSMTGLTESATPTTTIMAVFSRSFHSMSMACPSSSPKTPAVALKHSAR